MLTRNDLSRNHFRTGWIFAAMLSIMLSFQLHTVSATAKSAAKPAAKPKTTSAPAVNGCNKSKTMVELELKKQNIARSTIQCKGTDAFSMQWLFWNETSIPYRSGSYHVDPQNGQLISDADLQPLKAYRPQAELKLPVAAYHPMIAKAVQSKWALFPAGMDPLKDSLMPFRDYYYSKDQTFLYRRHLSSSLVDKSDLQAFAGREPGAFIFLKHFNGTVFKGITMLSTRQQIEKAWGKPQLVLATGSGTVAHYVLSDIFVSFFYNGKTATALPGFISVTERKRSGNATALIDLARKIAAAGKPPVELAAEWSTVWRLTDLHASTYDPAGKTHKFYFPNSGVTGNGISFVIYKNALSSTKEIIETAKWMRNNPDVTFNDTDLELQRVHQRSFPFAHLFLPDFQTGGYDIKVALSNPYRNDQFALYTQYDESETLLELFRDQDFRKEKMWADPFDQKKLLVVKNETYPFVRDVVYRIDLAAAVDAHLNRRLMPDWEIVFAPAESGEMISLEPKNNGMYALGYRNGNSTWISWVPASSSAAALPIAQIESKLILINNLPADRTLNVRFEGTAAVKGILKVTDDCHVNDVYLERHPDDKNASACADPTVKQYAYLILPLSSANSIPQFAEPDDLEAANPAMRLYDVVQTIRLQPSSDWWKHPAVKDGAEVNLMLSKLKYVMYQGEGTDQPPFKTEASAFTDLIIE